MVKSRGGQAIRARRGRSETSSLPISACPGGEWFAPMENSPPIAARSRRDACDERVFKYKTAVVKSDRIGKSAHYDTRLNGG